MAQRQAERQQTGSRRPASSKPVPGPGSSMPDEASPTAGGFESDYDKVYDRQQEDSNIFREVYSRQGEGTRPSSEGASVYQTQYGQSPMQQQQQHHQSQQPYGQSGQWSKDGADIFGGDEASPSSSSNNAPTPDMSSGSAWDRIRQQARPSQQRQSNPSQQQGSRWAEIQQNPQTTQPNQFDTSQSSSWSISPSSYPPQEPSQDTNREKEKAQREFDALLERERNFGADPGNAGQSGNQSGRWGR